MEVSEMNSNQQIIEAYLAELDLALRGQSKSLIQDALYDAESHIHDTLSENSDLKLSVIIADFGRAQDVANQYIHLETQTQNFLLGKPKQSRVNGFFEPLFDASAYKAIVYFLISWPLSIAYFAWFSIVGISLICLSLFGLGLPLLALYLKLQSYVALLEGQIVETLLGERMPRRPYYFPMVQQSKSLFSKIKHRLKTPHGWKVTLYTAVQLPLTSIYFAVSVCLFIASIGLTLSPIFDPIIHYFNPMNSIDIQWYWLPVCVPAGVIGITLSFHIANALSKLHRAIARLLLAA